MINYVKSLVHQILPAGVIRKINASRLLGITDAIRSIQVTDFSSLEIENQSYRVVTLDTGTQIVGHLPTKHEERYLGHLAIEKGLSKEYSKVLLDVVTRFVYSHMRTPLYTLPYPVNQRLMFHPQHENLVQQDETIPPETRQKIKEAFTPSIGWQVLDIGSFLGHGALWMQSQIGDSGRIVCVEASKQNFQVLVHSIQLNKAENIAAKNAAVWHTAGEEVQLTMTHRQRNAIDQEVVAGDESVMTTTETILSLSQMLGSTPDLVSLTVNGAEVEAIEGLKDVPRDFLPRRIIAPGWYLKNGEYRSKLILEMLREFGYECCETKGHFVVAWREH